MDQNTQNTQSNLLSVEEMQQKIAESLGIADLSDEKQKELIDKATEILLKKIFLENVERLSEEDKTAYFQLIESEAAPEALEKFLNEKITGYSDIIAKIVDDFVSEMKASGEAK